MKLKVLHFVGYPLDYAHGGHKFQIINTIRALDKLGVENEWLHNEYQDKSKNFDIVHFWTVPNNTVLQAIKSNLKAKLVLSTMLGTAGRKNKFEEYILREVIKLLKICNHPRLNLLVPNYDVLDTIIILNTLEKRHFNKIWGIDEKKIYVIPNGIDDIYFEYFNVEPIIFDGLLQIGAITPVKNSLEVARAAKKLGIRLKFIGEFRMVNEDYKQRFIKEIDNENIIYEGPIYNKLKLIRHIKGCKGVVVPSKWESYSLVVAEALALNQRVLLCDWPNLRSIYGDNVFYCHQPTDKKFLKDLEDFAKNNRTKNITYKPLSWDDVARMIYYNIYLKLL